MRRRFPNEALAGAIGLTLAFVGSGAWAQDRKGIRFWNLTLNTIIRQLQLSPAGKNAWVTINAATIATGPSTMTSVFASPESRSRPLRRQIHRQGGPHLHCAGCRGEGRRHFLDRGKATDGLCQVRGPTHCSSAPAPGPNNGPSQGPRCSPGQSRLL